MGLEINRYINARDVINDAIDRSSMVQCPKPIKERSYVICTYLFLFISYAANFSAFITVQNYFSFAFALLFTCPENCKPVQALSQNQTNLKG